MSSIGNLQGRRARIFAGSARIGVAACSVALLAGASTSSALGAVTIGQLAPDPTLDDCSNPQADIFNPTVTSGTSYVVPAGGVEITSWSTNAMPGAGQMLEMKVFREVSDLTYMAIGHDGPRPLVPDAVNTFQTRIPVRPGDVVGVNSANSDTVPNACTFRVTGQSFLYLPGDLADGESGTFNPNPDFRANVTAVVAFKPSNSFGLGGIQRNKRRGTASIAVNVPGPGTLSLLGRGVKAQRLAGGAVARVSRTVSGAGSVALPIRAKGSKKRKLNKRGKVKVGLSVVYTPNGALTGDVAGDPNTQSKRVKLIKK